jgi:hypothetical protein
MDYVNLVTLVVCAMCLFYMVINDSNNGRGA